MSDRLSDDDLGWIVGQGHPIYTKAAREVRESRALIAAIDALPDDSPHDPVFTPSYLHGYREAMRQVKALIHPEGSKK